MQENLLDGLKHGLWSAVSCGTGFLVHPDECRFLVEYIEYAQIDIDKREKTCMRCGKKNSGLDFDWHCSTCYREAIASQGWFSVKEPPDAPCEARFNRKGIMTHYRPIKDDEEW